MELKEFVSESLTQIISGIQDAQDKSKETGGQVVPSIIYNHHQGIDIISHIDFDPVALVKFDVSVTTNDVSNTKAGGGLFIAAFGAGAQTGTESSNNQLSRLQFTIPVALPKFKKE